MTPGSLGPRGHLARLALVPLVAALALATFPGPAGRAPSALTVGSVAPSDVIAPIGFLVLKPEAARAREAEALAASVKALVVAHPESAQAATRGADRFFARLDSLVGSGVPISDAAAQSGVRLDAADAASLRSAAVRTQVRLAIVRALARSSSGFLPAGVAAADLGREAALRTGTRERVVAVESLGTFSDFLVVAGAELPPAAAVAERAYTRLVSALFRPTLVYDRADTERQRDELRRSVDSVEAVVRAGEKIVGEHEVVTDAAARRVAALRHALGADRAGSDRVVGTIGRFGLDSLVLLLFGLLLYFYRPGLYGSWPATLVFAGGIALTTVAAGLLARQPGAHSELIPVAFPVFLFAVLFDGRIAASAAMTIAALIGAQPAVQSTDALVFCFVGGVAAALSMRRIASRTQAYASVVAVAAIYAAAAALSGAASGEPLASIGARAALGSVNALGSAALAMLLVPLVETWTHVTTDLRLLELSDPNQPLLRRLATEAPGTYAHSVAMANLCEAGCNAIGANGLLARVGCYYHDVGKLAHPLHFAENQARIKNPHDKLTAEQSAGIIRRHVEDGLALAAEHRLPEAVRRFIPEHHGTQEISYFLERARERGGDVREELFRYPGPRPGTAETAVALLADAVEAAIRVLDEPTPETVSQAIDHLIAGRVGSGQLAEAPLTLRQLDVVRDAFVRVLAGEYHNRVEYPEDAGGITADWEPSRD